MRMSSDLGEAGLFPFNGWGPSGGSRLVKLLVCYRILQGNRRISFILTKSCITARSTGALKTIRPERQS